MAMFLKDQGNRTELQQRVAAELQEKLAKNGSIKVDPVDPAFNEKQHSTRLGGVLIVASIIVALIVVIMLVSR